MVGFEKIANAGLEPRWGGLSVRRRTWTSCGRSGRIARDSSECHIAGLPIDPRCLAAERDEYYSAIEFYDQMLGRELPDDMREDLLQQREKSAEHAQSVAKWDAQFEDYLAYFKSKIFIDLRESRLIGLGAKVDGSNLSELDRNIDDYNIRIDTKQMQRINASEWMLRNIDWDHSILHCQGFSYCWVNFDVGAILDLYPMPKFPPIGTLWKLGDVYISEADEGLEDSPPFKRGRPSLPWDQFHIEVAALIKANALPEKRRPR